MGRDCYCYLWDKDPGSLEKEGIPRGYCGLCQVCGRPGHGRHFPGSVPYTGTWCDRHYWRLLLLHPLGNLGTFIWLAALAAIGVLAWKLVF